MLRHFNRNAANFGNENIEHSRTELNYNLSPDRGSADIDYYHERLSQVKCQNRADVKTLCSWIVTLPKQEFDEEQERRFFRSAYNFMAKRYGEENVVSAWVHKDEGGQPHMHFCFIPVCIDKKKGIEKVSAKEVLNRTELREIHKDMSDYMQKVFDRNVGILNGATVGGSKTVEELKLDSLKKDVAAMEKVRMRSLEKLVQAIKERPSLIGEISRAIRIAMGKEKLPQEREKDRVPERSR
ncbi:MAG: plasmid recombination protein [Clostridiales bacterium]|nr:plasmid recombination protein [Clostridiales bacterium]